MYKYIYTLMTEALISESDADMEQNNHQFCHRTNMNAELEYSLEMGTNMAVSLNQPTTTW